MDRTKTIFGLIFLIVALMIFSIAIASASHLCEDSQLIFRLSSSTNAHAEVYNGSNYLTRVCYDDFFLRAYNGAIPNRCTGNNSVLKLSGLTNAHAEAPNGTNYLTNICYGDLSCAIRTNGCLANEAMIVSLSGLTNAHVALDNSYSYGLCCSSASSPVKNETPDDGELRLEIISPRNVTYDTGLILINISSNGQSVWFNLFGANESYTSPIYKNLTNGTFTLYAFANNSNGTLLERSVTFSVQEGLGDPDDGGEDGDDDEDGGDDNDEEEDNGVIIISDNARKQQSINYSKYAGSASNYTNEAIYLSGDKDYSSGFNWKKLMITLLVLIAIALLVMIIALAKG